MKGYTVQVNNVSSRSTVRDLQNFFSFCGRILHIDLRSDGHGSQVALVSFKDQDALDTAVILSGATIIDQPVSIISLEDVDQEVGWEEQAVQPTTVQQLNTDHVLTRAQDTVANMLSKGYVLGKDALSRAKSFDESRQLSGNATSRASLSKRNLSFAEKLNAGASTVSGHVQSINERYHIAERTTSAYSYAQQGVKTAGTTIINNKMVQTGGMWVTGAFYRITRMSGNFTDNFKGRMNSSELPQFKTES